MTTNRNNHRVDVVGNLLVTEAVSTLHYQGHLHQLIYEDLRSLVGPLVILVG